MPATTSELLLFRLTEVLADDRPNLDDARNLLAVIVRDYPELAARADQVFRLYTPAGGGQPAPDRTLAATVRKTLAAPGPWGYLGIFGVLAAAFLGYYSLPAAGTKPPVAAASAYPLALPQFETAATGQLITFQHGRLVGLTVLPAPAGINLDGPLTTWDTRGRFRSAWASPYDNERYVEGCLFMDDQNLYLGAHVGDPWPLRGTGTATAITQGVLEGGGLFLRLATGDKHPGNASPPYPEDRLVHLALGYDQKVQKPYLRIDKGTKFVDAIAVSKAGGQDGFDATFAEDGDKRGYVVKARVPWKLLGLDDKPPYGRSDLGLCWEVCWSDPDGKHCVGKLTEFFDADRLRLLDKVAAEKDRLPGKLAHSRPEIWGKAICPLRP